MKEVSVCAVDPDFKSWAEGKDSFSKVMSKSTIFSAKVDIPAVKRCQLREFVDVLGVDSYESTVEAISFKRYNT